MHCVICDADSDSVTLTEPCGTCQEIIRECLSEFEDDEDEIKEEFDVGC